MPLAAVVGWCVEDVAVSRAEFISGRNIALGPFAGFMSAWNFGIWALLAVVEHGNPYGDQHQLRAWPSGRVDRGESHVDRGAHGTGLFVVILCVNVPGFGIGRWVSHFGTAVTVLVTVLLMGLLFYPSARQRERTRM
jgi:hypothetical protein